MNISSLLRTLLIPALIFGFSTTHEAVAREKGFSPRNNDRFHSDRGFPHRDHRPSHGTIGACKKSRKSNELSRRCFDALIRSPKVSAVLHDRSMLPGLADGRLSTDEISHTLLIAESVPNSRRQGIEPAPDEDAFIDRRVLEELRKAPQFDIASEVFTRQGPILVERYVPPRDTGFPFTPLPDNKNYLDIPGFTLDLHNTLAANVNGYAMRMRKNGATVATLQWNWARNPVPADAPAAGWNTNRRIHIVSLSKFVRSLSGSR